ncbi:MAG: dipeptidase [Clostridia bacterium]|nr:dipeptidase [Clostridia bacterium]
MKYCDLHCDALTAEGAPQITKENLAAGGCFLQCFAAFISARENRFSAAITLCDKFDALCKKEGYHAVTRAGELQEDKINALLTVEEGGAVEGNPQKLETLYHRGVRMMTLTWNYPNEIGYPNFPDYEGLKTGRSTLAARETEHGLTPLGFEIVERMHGLGMMVDVSHGSDKLFSDVASLKKPFVASHSNANSVCDCARNLTDRQIKTLADCGGVVGLNFCADFLSADQTAEGQRAALLAHARAVINAGGVEVLAIGSDFDGIPENPYLKNPSCLPAFFGELEKEFGSGAVEKITRKNFLRVFQEVCG